MREPALVRVAQLCRATIYSRQNRSMPYDNVTMHILRRICEMGSAYYGHSEHNQIMWMARVNGLTTHGFDDIGSMFRVIANRVVMTTAFLTVIQLLGHKLLKIVLYPCGSHTAAARAAKEKLKPFTQEWQTLDMLPTVSNNEVRVSNAEQISWEFLHVAAYRGAKQVTLLGITAHAGPCWRALLTREYGSLVDTSVVVNGLLLAPRYAARGDVHEAVRLEAADIAALGMVKTETIPIICTKCKTPRPTHPRYIPTAIETMAALQTASMMTREQSAPKQLMLTPAAYAAKPAHRRGKPPSRADLVRMICHSIKILFKFTPTDASLSMDAHPRVDPQPANYRARHRPCPRCCPPTSKNPCTYRTRGDGLGAGDAAGVGATTQRHRASSIDRAAVHRPAQGRALFFAGPRGNAHWTPRGSGFAIGEGHCWFDVRGSCSAASVAPGGVVVSGGAAVVRQCFLLAVQGRLALCRRAQPFLPNPSLPQPPKTCNRNRIKRSANLAERSFAIEPCDSSGGGPRQGPRWQAQRQRFRFGEHRTVPPQLAYGRKRRWQRRQISLPDSLGGAHHSGTTDGQLSKFGQGQLRVRRRRQHWAAHCACPRRLSS